MNEISKVYVEEKEGLSRIVFEIDNKKSIFQNQVSLIDGKGIKGTLGLQLLEEQDKTILSYNVGNRISLAKALNLSPIKNGELLIIFKNLLDILFISGQHNLYIDSFSVNIDHIFIDTNTNGVKLVYLPLETGFNFTKDFRTMLKNIFDKLASSVGEASSYVNKAVVCYKDVNLDIADFYKLVDTLLIEEAESKVKKGFFATLFGKKTAKRIPVKKTPQFIYYNKADISNKNNSINISESKSMPDKVFEDDFQDDEGATCFILESDDELTELISESTKNFSAVVAINNESIVKKQLEAGKASSAVDGKTEIKVGDYGLYFELTKFPCIIGRQSHSCNLVVEDKTVSRQHAQLLFDNTSLCIFDMDSKSGVTVNSVKIKPNEKFVLNEGDTIRMGMSEIKMLKING